MRSDESSIGERNEREYLYERIIRRRESASERIAGAHGGVRVHEKIKGSSEETVVVQVLALTMVHRRIA